MSALATPVSLSGDLSRISRPEILVYNPAPEPDTVEAFGDFYDFPAKGPGVVTDKYTFPVENTSQGRRVNFENKVLDVPANRIAEFIVGEHCRGPKGFVVLHRDGRDAERMAAAEERYTQWRIRKARQTQTQWMAKVAAITADPGAVPPTMPESVRADLEFLRLHREGVAKRKAYICKLDGFEADTRAEVEAWIREMHPAAVERMDAHIISPAAESGANQRQPSNEGVNLLRQAEEMGLALSVADRKGLQYGDADVITDIMDRMTKSEPGDGAAPPKRRKA